MTKVSKKVLIITDGTDSIQSIAQLISAAISEYKGKICTAQDFTGTDILPADIFFIGCEEKSPPSFSYLEEMLSHINLASRKCGIFSVNEKSIEYLRAITEDSEACTNSLLLEKYKINKKDIEKWVKGLI
jgi:hypothetical protein